MPGYMRIFPPLSEALRESVQGSSFRNVWTEDGLDPTRLSLGRDPSLGEVREHMRRIVRAGHHVYLNAVLEDPDGELPASEWFGFNEHLDWTHPSRPLGDVRYWMAWGESAVDVEEVQEIVFALLRLVETLQMFPDVAAVQRLGARITDRTVGISVLRECQAFVSEDPALDSLYDAEWRVRLGALAALAFRIALPPELEVPEGKIETYPYPSQGRVERLFPADDAAVRGVMTSLMAVAEALGREDAGPRLVRLSSHWESDALYQTDFAVRALMKSYARDVSCGGASDFLSEFLGGFPNLIGLLPSMIRIANAEGEQAFTDFAQCIAWECRDAEPEAFETVAGAHQEVGAFAHAFDERLKAGTW